jgi:hypothetical protein
MAKELVEIRVSHMGSPSGCRIDRCQLLQTEGDATAAIPEDIGFGGRLRSNEVGEKRKSGDPV